MDGNPNIFAQLQLALLQKQNQTNLLQNQFFQQPQSLFPLNFGQAFQPPNGSSVEDLERMRLLQLLHQSQQQTSPMLSNSNSQALPNQVPSLVGMLLGQLGSSVPQPTNAFMGASPTLAQSALWNSLGSLLCHNNNQSRLAQDCGGISSPSVNIITALERVLEELKSAQSGDKGRTAGISGLSGDKISVSPKISFNSQGHELEKLIQSILLLQSNGSLGALSNGVPSPQVSIGSLLEGLINQVVPQAVNSNVSSPSISNRGFTINPSKNIESDESSSYVSAESNSRADSKADFSKSKQSKPLSPKVMSEPPGKQKETLTRNASEGSVVATRVLDSHSSEVKSNQWGNLLDNTLLSFGSIDLKDQMAMADNRVAGGENEAKIAQHKVDEVPTKDGDIMESNMILQPSDSFSISELVNYDTLESINISSFDSIDPSTWDTDTLMMDSSTPHGSLSLPSASSASASPLLNNDSLVCNTENLRAPVLENSSVDSKVQEMMRGMENHIPNTLACNTSSQEGSTQGHDVKKSDHVMDIKENGTSSANAKPWKMGSSKWHEGIELLPLDTPIADIPDGQVFKNLEEKGKLRSMPGSRSGTTSNSIEQHQQHQQTEMNFSGKLSVKTRTQVSVAAGHQERAASPLCNSATYGPTASSPQSAYSSYSPNSVMGYSPVMTDKYSPRRGKSPTLRQITTTPCKESSPKVRCMENGFYDESPSRKRTWLKEEEKIESREATKSSVRDNAVLENINWAEKGHALMNEIENRSKAGLSDSDERGSGLGAGECLDEAKRRRRRATATDPRAVASRARRERIANRMRTLHSMVPNANQGDTATMLEEAIGYLRHLQEQVQNLSNGGINDDELVQA